MFVAKRFFFGFCALIGLSMLVFIMVRVVPGDPVRLVLGPMATEEDVVKLKQQMGLDQPIHVQYCRYINDILSKGKLGISLIEQRDVSDIISEKFMATVELILCAISISIILGIPLGVTAGTHRNKLTDHVSRLVALSGVSLPQFWTAIIIQLIFGLFLSLLPITGRITGTPPLHITGLYLLDSILTLNFSAFKDSFLHLVSPAVVLSLSPLANVTRLIRAGMIDELSKDYASVSQATGISDILINYKYVLRNAFSSSLSMLGFLIPIMIGGAFVVETVFAWPGLARFGAQSVISNDFNAVVGVAITIGVVFVSINIILDVLYTVLDPRIRLKR